MSHPQDTTLRQVPYIKKADTLNANLFLPHGVNNPMTAFTAVPIKAIMIVIKMFQLRRTLKYKSNLKSRNVPVAKEKTQRTGGSQKRTEERIFMLSKQFKNLAGYTNNKL